MVVQEKFDGEDSFKCEECGFHFRKENLAEKCENYCKEKSMCNSKITEKALERR